MTHRLEKSSQKKTRRLVMMLELAGKKFKSSFYTQVQGCKNRYGLNKYPGMKEISPEKLKLCFKKQQMDILELKRITVI